MSVHTVASSYTLIGASLCNVIQLTNYKVTHIIILLLCSYYLPKIRLILGKTISLLFLCLRWDLDPRTKDLQSNVLPLKPLRQDTSQKQLNPLCTAVQLWILDTIMDTTEKPCFLLLMFQMQPSSQIAYHKYWAILEAPTICTNGGSMNSRGLCLFFRHFLVFSVLCLQFS